MTNMTEKEMIMNVFNKLNIHTWEYETDEDNYIEFEDFNGYVIGIDFDNEGKIIGIY